jgi:hypothetical protein
LADGNYIDVHAWQFTPNSFINIINILFNLHLISLHPKCIFPTLRNKSEFYVVLQKTAHTITSLKDVNKIPDEFDSGLYLQANPDVRAAGISPILHYLSHGKREGRKLHP